MVIEAKANSKITYRDGRWYYNDDIPMSHDGPYRQADTSKWELKHEIEDKLGPDFCDKCKLLHAVWFPLVSRAKINKLKFPADASSEITLGADELDDPEPFISSIFEHDVNSIKTNLSDQEKENLFNYVLCPYCEIVEGYGTGKKRKDRVFHRMLQEQKDLLDYLAFQKTAAIQGIGGTGKTLIALERAKRLAAQGRKVLFLCYNKKLCEHLKGNFHFHKEQVDFYTIDGFTYFLTQKAFPISYDLLREKLETYLDAGYFEEYTDIIIDEGQDFGKEEIEKNNILQLLHDIITDKEIDGSFYIFYDKLQFVQGLQMPDIITNADCKITLYKNCRNTKRIAETSMLPLECETPQVNSPVIGDEPAFWFCADLKTTKLYLDAAITALKATGYDDIVILTCLTEEESILNRVIVRKNYVSGNYKVPFTTCRKFKGLEADAIIMVDVSRDVLAGDKGNLFYVGATRAKFELATIVHMNIVKQRLWLREKFGINADLYKDDITEILMDQYNVKTSAAVWILANVYVKTYQLTKILKKPSK
jgi:hypothetical protein